MDEISQLIRKLSIHNNPGRTYFDSFLPRYKMYRKAKVRRQKIMVAITVIVVMISGILAFKALEQNNLDIQTAAGIEHESK